MKIGSSTWRGLILAAIFIVVFFGQVWAQFAGGNGSSENPYQIATAEQLNAIRYYLTSHFVQIADLSLDIEPYNEATGWQAIGEPENPFLGSYDGAGFSIEALYINNPTTDYQALFGYAENAYFGSICLEAAVVTGKDYVAALVGCAEASQITNCRIDAEINGTAYTGALSGSLELGSMANSNNITANVSANYNVGGLCGYLKGNSQASANASRGMVMGINAVGGMVGTVADSELKQSYSTAYVLGTRSVGGLVGFTDSQALVDECYAIGVVDGSINTGGLIGRNFLGSTSDSYWNTESSNQNQSSGGVARTTLEMSYPFAQDTFVNWDFESVWAGSEGFNNAYPYFIREYTQASQVALLVYNKTALNAYDTGFIGVLDSITEDYELIDINDVADGLLNLSTFEVVISNFMGYGTTAATAFNSIAAQLEAATQAGTEFIVGSESVALPVALGLVNGAMSSGFYPALNNTQALTSKVTDHPLTQSVNLIPNYQDYLSQDGNMLSSFFGEGVFWKVMSGSIGTYYTDSSDIYSPVHRFNSIYSGWYVSEYPYPSSPKEYLYNNSRILNLKRFWTQNNVTRSKGWIGPEGIQILSNAISHYLATDYVETPPSELGEVFYSINGSQRTIHWYAVVDADYYEIWYSSNGTSWSPIGLQSEDGSGSYAWLSPITTANLYRVRPILGDTPGAFVDALPALAEITVMPSSVNLSLPAESLISETFEIVNIGLGDLDFSSQIMEGFRDLSIIFSPAQGVLAAGDTLLCELHVDSAATAQGLYEFTLQITSNDPDNPVINIPIAITVTSPIAYIPDDNFRMAINVALGQDAEYQPSIQDLESLNGTLDASEGEITNIEGAQHLSGLTAIRLNNNSINDLSPLGSLYNLQTMYLYYNQISDLSPLSNLTGLIALHLNQNLIYDLSPLSSLTNLEWLHLDYNQIHDISPLISLTNLQRLHLNHNQIVDISPLSYLPNLQRLYLGYNLINDISPLSNYTELMWLDLNLNQISDLHTLLSLNVSGTLYLNGNPISYESWLMSTEWAQPWHGSTYNQLSPCYPEPERAAMDVAPDAGLSWQANYDSSSTALYEVYLGTNADTLSFIGEGTWVDSTNYNFATNLEPFTEYWWRVKAVEDSTEIWSGLWSFTTGEEVIPEAILSVYPEVIEESIVQGSADQVELEITNSGNAALYWTATVIEVRREASSPVATYPRVTAELRPGRDSRPGMERYELTKPEESERESSLLRERNVLLDLDPDNGMVEAESSVFCWLNIDSSGSLSGTYEYQIVISSNAVNEPELIIPVSITVEGTPAYIPDDNFRIAINDALGQGADNQPSIEDLESLNMYLDASSCGITNIEGAQYLSNLYYLYLQNNQITDLSPLSFLSNLGYLVLDTNQISDINPLANLINLQDLDLAYNQISDLTPLANLGNLQYLYLVNNQISDLSPLSNLINLQDLDLAYNQISDLTPLANLGNLQGLYLLGNQISDLSPLSNLSNLQGLYLYDNQISDLSPLSNLSNLSFLELGSNPISHESMLLSQNWSLPWSTDIYEPLSPCYPDPQRETMDVAPETGLSWQANYNSSSTALYEVYLGTAPDSLYYLGEGNQLDGTFYHLATNLEPLTEYWWKVKAIDGASEIWSGLWSFTTGETISDLAVIDITGPRYLVRGETASYQVEIQNAGNTTETEYSIHLINNEGVVLYTAAGLSLAPGYSMNYILEFIPQEIYSGSVYAEIAMDTDAYPTNNQSMMMALDVVANIYHTVLGSGDMESRCPLDFYYQHSIFETVYQANELNFAGDVISLEFFNSFASDLSNMPTEIWMGTTELDNLSEGWINATELTQVFSGMVNYPAGENTIEIPLQTPYNYSGGNLAIMVHRPMDTGYYGSTDRFKCQVMGSNRSRMIHSDSTVYDPNDITGGGTLSGEYPQTGFRVIGYPMNLPPSNLAIYYAFNEPYVELVWDAPIQGNPLYYNIYRNSTLLDTTSATVYHDAAIYAGMNLQYNITAVYQEGESSASNTEEVFIEFFPIMVLNPESFSIEMSAGSINQQELVVHNDGGSPLSWSSQINQVRLIRAGRSEFAVSVSLEPSNGWVEPDSSMTCVLTIDADSLGFGNYEYSLQIDADSPMVSSQTIPIFIQVNAPLASIPDDNFRLAINEALGQDVDYQPSIPDLESLSGTLDAAGREIVSIEGAQHLINLDVLYLDSNQIQDISPVSTLVSLDQLYLGFNQMSDLSPLSSLTNLGHLYLYNNQISDISALATMTGLGEIYLNNNQLSDITALGSLTSLQWLYLNNNQISDISPLASLLNLHYLDLPMNDIIDISPLANLIDLLTLNLNNNQISDLSPLSNLTNLAELDLSDNQISNISSLANLTNLNYLFITNNLIHDISPISNMINLWDLDLYYNQINDLSPLANLSTLTDLELGDNAISDISPLANLTGLNYLGLSANPISYESLQLSQSWELPYTTSTYEPLSPCYPEPERAAMNVTPETGLSWQANYDYSTSALYLVYLGTAPDSLYYLGDGYQVDGTVYHLATNLQPLTEYWWRVKAVEDTTEIWSGMWSFTTGEEVIPTNVLFTGAPGQYFNTIGNNYAYHAGTHYLVWSQGRHTIEGNEYDGWVKLSTSSDGIGWTTQDLIYNPNGGSEAHCIVFDEEGYMHLLYLEETNPDSWGMESNDLVYATNTSGEFTKTVLANANDYLAWLPAALTINPNGTIHVFYNRFGWYSYNSPLYERHLSAGEWSEPIIVSDYENGSNDPDDFENSLNSIFYDNEGNMHLLVSSGWYYLVYQGDNTYANIVFEYEQIDGSYVLQNTYYDTRFMMKTGSATVSVAGDGRTISMNGEVVDVLPENYSAVNRTLMQGKDVQGDAIVINTVDINTNTNQAFLYLGPNYEREVIEAYIECVVSNGIMFKQMSGSSTQRMIAVSKLYDSAPLEVAFDSSSYEGEAPFTVSFEPTITGSYETMLWDFGDGFQSNDTYVEHQYDEAGEYVVRLSANQGWQHASTSITITVNEPPFSIPDDNFRLAINAALGQGAEYQPTEEDMNLMAGFFSAPDMQIQDITGASLMTNVTGMNLQNNQISDLSPLAGLSNLEILILGSNQCNELYPLSGLTSLHELWLHENQIEDIRTLANCTSLNQLVLYSNQINDVSPLSDLSGLQELNLTNNMISDFYPLAGLTGLDTLYLADNYPSYESMLLSQSWELPYTTSYFHPVAPCYPEPARNATNVNPELRLSWQGNYDYNYVSFQVYLGTDPADLALAGEALQVDGTEYGFQTTLEPFTEYYWMVHALNDSTDIWSGLWSFTTGEVPPEFAGGSGTQEDPYLVATAEHLNNVRNHLDAYFLQTADIDLSVAPWYENDGWVAIGTPSTPFTGTYDGDSYHIDNMFFNHSSTDYQGLFGAVSSANILNTHLRMANVSGNNWLGILIGYANTSTIESCSAAGQVNGQGGSVGGLIGRMDNSDLYDSMANAYINGGGYSIGGLVGRIDASHITRCFADGIVQGTGILGGLVGYILTGSSVNLSYSAGSIYSEGNYVGGITGSCVNASITNCYSTAYANGNSYVGGLVGETDGASITNCYSFGAVGGEMNIGGLIGFNTQNSFADNSYWDMDTSEYQISALGEGRSFAEMTYPCSTNTYVQWDFNETWVMDESGMVNSGYPYLSWQDEASGLDAPSNLTAVYNTGNGGVVLAWDIPSQFVTYYKIYRSITGDVQDLAEYDLADGSPYMDISGEVDYLYAVSAIYNNGESALSNYAWASRMQPVVVELRIMQDQSELSWIPTREATEYSIYWTDDPAKAFPAEWSGPHNSTENIYHSPLAERRFFRVFARIPSRRQTDSSGDAKTHKIEHLGE